jgi:polyisoprenyl-phosphate glycosyltransferase
LKVDLRRPLRFAVVGVVNTCSGLAIIYLLKWTLSADDFAANLVGYTAGLAISLMLNSRWTFGYDGRLVEVAFRFLAVVVLAYLANWAVVRVSLSQGLNSYLCQTLGVFPYALLSYLGMKHFVYRVEGPRG